MKRMMGKSLFSCGAACTALVLILGILNSSSATTCGQPVIKQRVVGGQNSTLGKYPWMASLVYRGSHVCGASLISTKWAVTAAHCTKDRKPAEMMLMIGVLALEGYTGSRIIVNVNSFINHPIYMDSGDSGDLSLLELKTSVTYSNYILPICLPEPGQNFPYGKMCVLTGWGYKEENVALEEPYILQNVELPLITYYVCEEMYKSTFSSNYPGGLIHSDMICAGYTDGKKDGCQGDSGGPLACLMGDHWLLVGIVSWGVGCAIPGAPGVYTRVSNFTNWIKTNTDLKDSTTSQPPKPVTTTVTTTVKTSPPSTTESPKPATTAVVCFNEATTAKPKNAAQSLNLINGSESASLQHGDPTGCGHRSSSPMCLLAVGLILTKILGLFQ